MNFPEQQLRDALPDDACTTGDAAASCAILGKQPQAVVFPESVDQVCAVMRIAHEHNLAVAPRGCGSKMYIGNPPERLDLVLSLERLNQVENYAHGDMTMKLQAGVRLQEVLNLTADHQQTLPVDPPDPANTTMGGLCATNITGPLRYSAGSFRPHLLGVTAVMADGTITTAGGMVVKNVTGFNLNKLYAGSLGTLAVIVGVNVKLRPKPANERTLCAAFSDRDTAVKTGYALMDSCQLPAFIELANAHTAKAAGAPNPTTWNLIVGFEGFSTTVDAEVSEMVNRCRAEGVTDVQVLEQAQGMALRESLRNYPNYAGDNGVILRVTIPASACNQWYAAVETAPMYDQAVILSHFGCGVYQVMLPDTTVNAADALQFVQAVSIASTQCDGRMFIEKAPATITEHVPVWGEPTDDWTLMRKIKDTIDPRHILNPGRFVGGI
jgi:glycolate oxidase FAD binding subunit